MDIPKHHQPTISYFDFYIYIHSNNSNIYSVQAIYIIIQVIIIANQFHSFVSISRKATNYI